MSKIKNTPKRSSNNRKRFMKGEELDNPVMNNMAQLPQVDTDDSIESMFRNEQTANQNDIKELFHEDKVKARTDISARQIKLITKAFYLAEITGMSEIKAILSDFLVLSISKDRKSRLEYVEGLKARIDDSLKLQNGVRGQFGR